MLRNKLRLVMAVAAAAFAVGSACAVNRPAIGPQCIVSDGDNLPPETGGAAALCTAIMKAVAERGPSLPASVDVRVLSNSSLSATVKLTDGRVLPEQKMAVSDRQLDSGSIARFAAAIADQIAEASTR